MHLNVTYTWPTKDGAVMQNKPVTGVVAAVILNIYCIIIPTFSSSPGDTATPWWDK